MKLLHVHTSLKQDYLNNRKLKKLALSVIIDALGFSLGKKDFENELILNYNKWLHSLKYSRNGEILSDKYYIIIKRRLKNRLRLIYETCYHSEEVLNTPNLWLDILNLNPSLIKQLRSEPFEEYKINLSVNVELDKIERPYHKLLDKIDMVQFV